MNTKDKRIDGVKEIAEAIINTVCLDWQITAKDRGNLTVAIAMAIVQDRAGRPHVFVGPFDRYCEVCGEPDRDAAHVFANDRLVKALEFERRVCIEIILGIANKYLPNPAVVQSHSDAAAFSAIQEVAAEFAVRGRMYDGAGDFRELVQKARAQCAAIADVEKRTCAEQAKAHEKNKHAALSFLGGEIAARNIGESIREIED